MNQTEYLAENSDRAYPFKDGSSLFWNYTGSGSIGMDPGLRNFPNNIVLDLQLNLKSTIGLTGLYFNGITFDGSQYTFHFSGLDNADIVINGSELIQTFSTTTDSGVMALTVDLYQLSQYFLALPAGVYTLAAPAQVCVGCIRLQPEMVTEIQLLNNTPTGVSGNCCTFANELVLGVSAVPGVDSSVNITAASNLTVTEPAGIQLDVIPGSGAGLFNNCPTTITEITTINNTSPDSYGNASISTDGCWQVSPNKNGLGFNNSCKPVCQSSDVLNFAYYLNRMLNRTMELGSLAQTAGTQYNSMITSYTACQTSQATSAAPYLLAQSSTLSNKSYNFHNIACGIYSSNTSNMAVSLTCGYNSSTPVPGYALVPKSCYFSQNNVKTTIPAPSLTAVSLPPNSVSFFGLVLDNPASTPANLGNGLYDILFTLTSLDGVYTSGYCLPLNPASVNCNVSYIFEKGSVINKLTITVELVSPLSQTSVASALLLEVPGYFDISSSLLIQNNGAPSDLGSTLGFNNTYIDFSKPNQYNVVLTCPASQTSLPAIAIALTTAAGSTYKTIN